MRRRLLYLTIALLTLATAMFAYVWLKRDSDPCKELMSGKSQAMTPEELNQKLKQCPEIKHVKPILGS
jgi:hypothetical protein